MATAENNMSVVYAWRLVELVNILQRSSVLQSRLRRALQFGGVSFAYSLICFVITNHSFRTINSHLLCISNKVLLSNIFVQTIIEILVTLLILVLKLSFYKFYLLFILTVSLAQIACIILNNAFRIWNLI